MSGGFLLRFGAALLLYCAAAFFFGIAIWGGVFFAAVAEGAVYAAANWERSRLQKWSGWGAVIALLIPMVVFVCAASLGGLQFQFIWWHRVDESYEPFGTLKNMPDRASFFEPWLAAAKAVFMICGFAAAVSLFLWLLFAMIFNRHTPSEEWTIRAGVLAVFALWAVIFAS
jgi:hypothetical protein